MQLEYLTELIKLGLTKNEAIFYETLLKYGPANASQISQLANMDKSSAYRAAEQLVKQGLIKYELKKEKIFIPNPPEILLQIIEQKEKLLEKERKDIKTLVKNIHQNTKLNSFNAKIIVYEDINAPQRIWEDMLEPDVKLQRQMIRIDIQKFIVDQSDLYTYEKWVEDYIRRRVQKEIHLHYLCSEEWADQKYTKTDPKLLKEVRVLPKNIKLETNIITGGNKFGTHTVTADNTIKGVLIRDQNITETQNQLFDFIWEQSTKL